MFFYKRAKNEGGISIKSTIKRTIVAAPAFILMSIGGVFGTVLIDEMLSGKSVQPHSFAESIDIIASDERCTKWFLIFEAAALLLAAMLIIMRNDYYKSKRIKITDEISIPVPEGQGRHGTARFMTKREQRKTYKGFILDSKNPVVMRLENEGKKHSQTAEREGGDSYAG